MSSDRTEKVTINMDRALARRLKVACARLRISADDVFEIGFNATFPSHKFPTRNSRRKLS